MSNRLKMGLFGGVVILMIALAMSSFVGAASQNATSTIGFVDSERLQAELPDYKNLQDVLKDKQSEFNLFQSYLFQKHGSELKALDEQAKKEKDGKSADEQAAIDKKYKDEAQKKADDIKTQLDQKRSEIQKFLNDQKKSVDEKMKKVIADVAADKKLTAVMDKNALYYGGTDITDAVIEKAKKDASKK